jgi:tRNA A-37 threonylcarbamoyl transferase component Bud32/tetratricopeptide (TPR) repeat protein
MPFASGENVGAYRIVEKLGQGGMATVYKAYHPALDRYVAIKVMHPAFMEDPNFLARFQREARIVAKLDHPHIIPIYDFAEHNGHPYLVMRFIEGETLKARIKRGPLPPSEIVRIARAVGQALTYAHGQGVLHRDIKPSNILLTLDGGVYLTDFGLARMAEAGESTLSRDMMLGTPQYISPEQAKGIRNLDARTDVYSLGVVLYELLVGQVPFTADTPYAIVHNHIFSPLPIPRELNPDLPESLERVLLKALAKDPGDRFQSVEELATTLEASLKPPAPEAKETVVVPPPSTVAPPPPPGETAKEPAEAKPRPQRRRWPWIVAAIAAAVCLGVSLCFGIRFLQRRAERLEARGENAEALLEEAQAAHESGDLERALELYEAAARANPQMVPAYMEASRLLLEMGRGEAALEALARGIEANSDVPELHAMTAGTALLLDKLDVAQGEVEWMLREMPDNPLTHAFDGVLILEQGRPCNEGRPALEKALRAEPDLAWAHYGMALCLAQEGNRAEAREELFFVLDYPETPEPLRRRADELLARLEGAPPPPDGERPDPADEAVLNEFDVLMNIAQDVEDEGLRQHLKTMLDEARSAWKDGDREHSLHIVEDLISWVEENAEALNPEQARMLTLGLRNILRLAR